MGRTGPDISNPKKQISVQQNKRIQKKNSLFNVSIKLTDQKFLTFLKKKSESALIVFSIWQKLKFGTSTIKKCLISRKNA